jgi:hypothetical protein
MLRRRTSAGAHRGATFREQVYAALQYEYLFTNSYGALKSLPNDNANFAVSANSPISEMQRRKQTARFFRNVMLALTLIRSGGWRVFGGW